MELPAPGLMSLIKEVPAVVPSVPQISFPVLGVVAEKYSLLSKTVKELGELLLEPGLIS